MQGKSPTFVTSLTKTRKGNGSWLGTTTSNSTNGASLATMASSTHRKTAKQTKTNKIRQPNLYGGASTPNLSNFSSMANSLKPTGSFNAKMSLASNCQTSSNRSSLGTMNANLKRVDSSTGLSSPKAGNLAWRKKTSTGRALVQVGSLASAERAGDKQRMVAQATFGKEVPAASGSVAGQTAAQATWPSDGPGAEAKATGDGHPTQRGIKRFGSNPMVRFPANQGLKASPDPAPIRNVRSPTSTTGPLKANSPEMLAPNQKAPKIGIKQFSLVGHKSERHLEGLNAPLPSTIRDLRSTPPM